MTQPVRVTQLDIGSMFGGMAAVAISALMVGMIIHEKPEKRGVIIPVELSPEVEDIASRAQLNPRRYKFLSGEEEDIPKRKGPVSVKTVEIGSYVIRVEYRKDGCTLKLYENLPGWKRALRATQTADSLPGCEALLQRTREVVRQIRFEQRIGSTREIE